MTNCIEANGIRISISERQRRMTIGRGLCLIVNRGVKGADGIGTLNELLAMLSTMTPYDSDESAALGGVQFEEWYRTSDNHVTTPGTIKQNLIP